MYIYTFDKEDYKNEVKQFEKIMQLVNLGNIINFNNYSITVTYIEMRSTISGKYFQSFSTWYKIFEYVDYQDVAFTKTTTLQKLYNHINFMIQDYIKCQHDFRVYNIVKYDSIDKFSK